MPGIAGIVGTFPEENRTSLELMVGFMEHESFYTSGMYVNEKSGIWIGWAGHENSFEGMPSWNETEDICVIFAGEVFIDPSVVRRLTSGEHHCAPNNASCLVHLYEQKGIDFIKELDGWFCGFIVDSRIGKAFLFNDRYGMHRIFIHESKDGLYFASEAKAVLAAIHEPGAFDLKGVGEFLTCGCTLGARSLFESIQILPAGSLLTFANGKIESKALYFSVGEWIGQERLDAGQFSNRMLEFFGPLVRKYSGGPLPVGISLTGGLDSRMVIACLETRTDKFPCYTFGSMYRDTFDVQVARKVAKACNQNHHTLVVGEDFLRDFPDYLQKAVYRSDGYIGLSGAAELYVNSLARSIAPVRLTGNYGGELLRGVRAFKSGLPKGEFVTPDLMPHLHEAQGTFQRAESTDAVTFALFHQAPSQGFGRLAVERSQVVLRTPFMDNHLVKLVYKAPPHALKGEGLCEDIISRYGPDLLQIPTDRGLLGAGSHGARVRRFYREALIKSEYFASHGMPAWLAALGRFGVSRILERSFLGRDKFQHFRTWTQKRFAGHIEDLLIQGGRDLGDLFRRPRIETMVREHLAGRQNYTSEIDKILTLAIAAKTRMRNGKSQIQIEILAKS